MIIENDDGSTTVFRGGHPNESTTEPEKLIYMIMVFFGDPRDRAQFRSAQWGYYFDQDIAAQCIEENWADISERGYFEHARLASVGEGPLAIPEDIQWYRFEWDAVTDDVVFRCATKIDCPRMYSSRFSSNGCEADDDGLPPV